MKGVAKLNFMKLFIVVDQQLQVDFSFIFCIDFI